MEFADMVQIIMNNGMGLSVAIYFLFKDWKQSSQRIDADKSMAEANVAQTEVLRQLCSTVDKLSTVVERMGDK